MSWLLDTPGVELSSGLRTLLSTLRGLEDALAPEVTSALHYLLVGYSGQSMTDIVALSRESLDHDERTLVDAIDVLLTRVPRRHANDFLDQAHIRAFETLKACG